MTRKKRRALLCMLAVPLLALAPRSEESLPASAAEPAAMPEKYVALTFDDGPWPETTEQLLDGLAERGAKATFFLIGEQIAGHEDTVRRMADEGHQVGSHTFTHMDLSRGDPAERLREIEGIGPKRQTELIRHFKSVKAIFNATEDELCQVEGISKEMARRILEHGRPKLEE